MLDDPGQLAYLSFFHLANRSTFGYSCSSTCLPPARLSVARLARLFRSIFLLVLLDRGIICARSSRSTRRGYSVPVFCCFFCSVLLYPVIFYSLIISIIIRGTLALTAWVPGCIVPCCFLLSFFSSLLFTLLSSEYILAPSTAWIPQSWPRTAVIGVVDVSFSWSMQTHLYFVFVCFMFFSLIISLIISLTSMLVHVGEQGAQTMASCIAEPSL